MSDRRSRAYLTLVNPGVFPLRIPNPESPFLGVRRVDRLESLIGRVGVPADRQQVNIPVPHPRNLKKEEGIQRV